MKLPILVIFRKSGLVYIYDSIAEATVDLECLFSPDDEFDAYDAEGHLLRVDFSGGAVTIALREGDSLRLYELRVQLSKQLALRHVPADDTMAIGELIVKLQHYRIPPETPEMKIAAKIRDRCACCLFALGISFVAILFCAVALFMLYRLVPGWFR